MITPMEVIAPIPLCVERRIDMALWCSRKSGNAQIVVALDEILRNITGELIERIRRHYEAAGWKIEIDGFSIIFTL